MLIEIAAFIDHKLLNCNDRTHEQSLLVQTFAILFLNIFSLKEKLIKRRLSWELCLHSRQKAQERAAEAAASIYSCVLLQYVWGDCFWVDCLQAFVINIIEWNNSEKILLGSSLRFMQILFFHWVNIDSFLYAIVMSFHSHVISSFFTQFVVINVPWKFSNIWWKILSLLNRVKILLSCSFLPSGFAVRYHNIMQTTFKKFSLLV